MIRTARSRNLERRFQCVSEYTTSISSKPLAGFGPDPLLVKEFHGTGLPVSTPLERSFSRDLEIELYVAL